MDFLITIWGKILKALRVKAAIGGLEISDSNLRYTIFSNNKWLATSAKLPPGLLENNRIKDQKQFLEILKNFAVQIKDLTKARGKINTMVSLSSVSVYSQVFNLPILEKEENLEKAIQLNIQMISPMEKSQTYSGWQILDHKTAEMKLEILSTFIGRDVIDEVMTALRGAGFLPLTIESRSLSLSRLVREGSAGIDIQKIHLLFILDASGVDMIIIRSGYAYFEYFNSWAELQGENRQLSFGDFQNVIIRNINQVLNYYSLHFSEPLEGVILGVSGVKDEVTKVIKDNFPTLKIEELVLKSGESIDPAWYIVLGCALRGLVYAEHAKEINLLGIDIQAEFQKQQLITFLDFWRALFPASLAILLVALFGTTIFLTQVNNDFIKRQADLHISADQLKDMQNLQAQVNQFNSSVNFIKQIQAGVVFKSPLLFKINGLFIKENVELTNFVYQGAGTPVSLNGASKNQDQIIALKKDFDADPTFQNVDLPLNQIQIGPKGYTFTLSFNFKS